MQPEWSHRPLTRRALDPKQVLAHKDGGAAATSVGPPPTPQRCLTPSAYVKPRWAVRCSTPPSGAM